jgi:hypothetical protein
LLLDNRSTLSLTHCKEANTVVNKQNNKRKKMTFKLFKSTWTWRSLAQQDVALSEYASAPAFIDDDRGLLIRPTTRKMNDIVVAAAMPVFAQTEADLTEFLNHRGGLHMAAQRAGCQGGQGMAADAAQRLLEARWVDLRGQPQRQGAGGRSEDQRPMEVA